MIESIDPPLFALLVVAIIASSMAAFGLNLIRVAEKEKQQELELARNKNNNFNINFS